MAYGTTPISPGAGAEVAVDDVGGDLYQAVKIVDGVADGTTPARVTPRGLEVDGRRKWARILISPTLSTSVYAAGDNMGGALTISGAVRESGAPAVLRSVVLSNAQPTLAADLWLVFTDRAITGTHTDQAPFDPGADDGPFITGIVRLLAADLRAFASTSVATYSGLEVPLRANAGVDAGLYLVAQGAIDLTTSGDLEVVLHVEHL